MTDNEAIIEYNRNLQFSWYKRKYEQYQEFIEELHRMATVANSQQIIAAIEVFKREQDSQSFIS